VIGSTTIQYGKIHAVTFKSSNRNSASQKIRPCHSQRRLVLKNSVSNGLITLSEGESALVDHPDAIQAGVLLCHLIVPEHDKMS